MSFMPVILICGWMSICLVWIFLLWQQFQVRRRGLILEPLESPTTVTAWPEVCVVIPARNEGAQIAECLAGVCRQDYPMLSIMVVDDRSEDETAALVQRVADQDSRVHLRRLSELPAGWLGKSHALWQGTRGVTSAWLLFLDADCTLHPAAVRTAVAEAQRRGVDMLTLWPRHAAGSFWEHMTIPLCGGIIALFFGSRNVGCPESGPAFANGQFLLIHREAYERLDGHRGVQDAIIEDVVLAERARSAGLRCWVAAGQHLASVRMYTHYAAIRDGWARIYVGALRNGWKIAAGVLWLLVGSLLPFAVVGWMLVARLVPVGRPTGPETWLVPQAMACLHIGLIMVVSYGFWGLGGCKRRYLLLYPISSLVVIGILLRAWWWLVIRRRVSWRTTSYRIDGRGRIVPAGAAGRPS